MKPQKGQCTCHRVPSIVMKGSVDRGRNSEAPWAGKDTDLTCESDRKLPGTLDGEAM